MFKYFDINEQGFSIRCKLYYNKDIHSHTDVVIATYGFGGNKDNKAVEKFADRITTKYKGYVVICFDWPCHGLDARNQLHINECITYLETVIKYAKDQLHAKRIYNYSSSFGAYVTLRFIHERKDNPFDKIAFRCAAIKMHEALARDFTSDDIDKLNKGKEILRGHDRKIKITKDLMDDLEKNDIRQYDYMEYADNIIMLHGTKDEAVPIEDAIEFSENNVIELYKVENADHPFTNPDYMDFAIQKIIEFFHP